MPVKHQLLFVQGGGAGAHDEWDDKLVESLRRALGPDYDVRYPRMPNEAEPSYTAWRKALERELDGLKPGAIVVGHSIGATILLKVLEGRRSAEELRAIVALAAPFVGDGGWPVSELEISPDIGARLPRGVPIHFFHGLVDDTAPPAHVDLYARAVPRAKVHRLADRDHQLNDDLSEVAATISSLQR